MLVVLSGCDRSGKSTLFEKLKPLLPFARFVPGVPIPLELKPHVRELELREINLWRATYDPCEVYIADRCVFVDSPIYARIYDRPIIEFPEWRAELRVLYVKRTVEWLKQRSPDAWSPVYEREVPIYDEVVGELEHEVVTEAQEAAAAVRRWVCEEADLPRRERMRMAALKSMLHYRRKRGRPAGDHRRKLELELQELRIAAQRRRVADVRGYYRGQLGQILGLPAEGSCELGEGEARVSEVEKLLSKQPSGAVLCHRCDVRECREPSHLFWGTQRDNVRDALLKGRFSSRRSHAELLAYEEGLLADMLRQYVQADFSSAEVCSESLELGDQFDDSVGVGGPPPEAVLGEVTEDHRLD